MSNTPTVSKEAQVLLKLLRIALRTEPMQYFGDPVEPFPMDIFWKEVARLSYEQKVSALAVDGLKSIKYDPHDGLDDTKKIELETIIEPWINDVHQTEESYQYYVEVLKLLCQIFTANGLTPIILKGYGLSQNYPNPSHRGAGDIDIFLIDKEGNPAADKGDEIARNILNLQVTRIDKEHHSSFNFKGILIENHYELRGGFFKTDAEKRFLETLKGLVKQDLIPIPEIEGAFYPSGTFNAVFLMRHMIGNLHHGLLNLRQITDWITFVKANRTVIDWNKVDRIQTEAELNRFSVDMNHFMTKCFGLSNTTMTNENIKTETYNHILYSIFNPVHSGQSLWERIVYYYRNRWATRYFFNQHWSIPMFKSIYCKILR